MTNKRLANLVADLALAGFTLVRTTDDRGGPMFVVSRWERTRLFNSIDDLAAFTHQVTP